MASRKAKLQGLSIRAERTLIPFKNRLIYPDPDDISAVFFCRRSHHIRNLSTNGSQ